MKPSARKLRKVPAVVLPQPPEPGRLLAAVQRFDPEAAPVDGGVTFGAGVRLAGPFPVTPDLADKGFPLVGGRLDYIAGRVTPALVYKRWLHTVNLFVWPAKRAELPVAMSGEVDGYHFLRWARGGMVFWAVSDMNPRDLEDFRERWGAV